MALGFSCSRYKTMSSEVQKGTFLHFEIKALLIDRCQQLAPLLSADLIHHQHTFCV